MTINKSEKLFYHWSWCHSEQKADGLAGWTIGQAYYVTGLTIWGMHSVPQKRITLSRPVSKSEFIEISKKSRKNPIK